MKKLFRNKIFLLITSAYMAMLVIVSCFTCFFAYKQKQGELLSEMDLVLTNLVNKYQNITDNFWQLYMPIFENEGEGYQTISDYFSSSVGETLPPQEQKNLLKLLSQMSVRENNVQWIALFSETRKVNYIYFVSLNRLLALPDDFAYLDALHDQKNDSMLMKILEAKTVSAEANSVWSFAIIGGVPDTIGTGKILVGYGMDEMKQVCKSNNIPLKTLNFHIVSDGTEIFSSAGKSAPGSEISEVRETGVKEAPDGSKVYCGVADQYPRRSYVFYTVSWDELFLSSNSKSILLIISVVLLAVLSVVLYFLMLRLIGKEVDTIRVGLDEIGNNHLDCRISGNFYQSGFHEIAESINAMAENLQESVARAYQYQIRQRDAELESLQAKFNPHFLYNSLEIFRARCYQNGDADTAELIAQLGAIFRGLYGSKSFISIQEELSFSKRYLSLYRARYGDKVRILYDFDTEVLKYGIIRNVFQPLVENYFIHGYDTSKTDNTLLFRGQCLEDRILIQVVDNGIRVSDEEIRRLNSYVSEPDETRKKSYGLKNLYQRIRLFYGEEYGLTIRQESGGFLVEIAIARLTCEQYEEEIKRRDTKSPGE